MRPPEHDRGTTARETSKGFLLLCKGLGLSRDAAAGSAAALSSTFSSARESRGWASTTCCHWHCRKSKRVFNLVQSRSHVLLCPGEVLKTASEESKCLRLEKGYFIKFSQEAMGGSAGSGTAASVAAIVNTATETRVDKNNMDAARRRPALADPARQNP